MDDKMTVEITGFDAEKHTEDAVKRVTTYSELLIHHASIVSEKNIRNSSLKDWKTTTVTLFVRQVTLIAILQLTVRCSLSF